MTVRVAVEGIDLQQTPLRGAGRVLANVLRRLPDDIEIDVLVDASRPDPVDVPGRLHRLRAAGNRRIAFTQVAIPRWLAGRSDLVLHGPFHTLPIATRLPKVVTFHDLGFESHPDWYRPLQRRSFQLQARLAARSASVVLTVSQWTADEVTSRYGVPTDRVLVARNGIDQRFLDHVPKDADPGARPFVLALGGAPRRQADVALAAWRRLRDAGHDIDLVLLNEPDPLEAGVTVVQRPDDDEVLRLLAEARLLLYPTGMEGFGLPALEAAAVGTPVVCARIGALPEVLGTAGVWADDDTPATFALAAARVLDDAVWRAERCRVGRERARLLGTWDASVAAHVEAYRRAAPG